MLLMPISKVLLYKRSGGINPKYHGFIRIIERGYFKDTYVSPECHTLAK